MLPMIFGNRALARLVSFLATHCAAVFFLACPLGRTPFACRRICFALGVHQAALATARGPRASCVLPSLAVTPLGWTWCRRLGRRRPSDRVPTNHSNLYRQRHGERGLSHGRWHARLIYPRVESGCRSSSRGGGMGSGRRVGRTSGRRVGRAVGRCSGRGRHGGGGSGCVGRSGCCGCGGQPWTKASIELAQPDLTHRAASGRY